MIAILAYIALLFSLLQLGVALANLFTKERLPENGPGKAREVSVLIPVRDEASNIPFLLNDLLHLPESPLEILLCDDHSQDDTFRIVSEIAVHHPQVRIFKGDALPAGWQGKNFACYQLAQKARGKYLLFLDADVRLSGHCIGRSVGFAEKYHTGLLSVFPRQLLLSPGEKATVPVMTYILLTLLPLSLVYRVKDQSALTAANGQYMFFETDTYRTIQPHREVRHCPVEDMAIATLYKKNRIPVACLTGIKEISCRMYHSAGEAIRGFSRSIAAFFGGSIVLAILFWFFTSWGWIFILLSFSWQGLLFYLLLRILLRSIVALACQQSVKDNLLWAACQQINMAFMLVQAIRSKTSGKQEWKGRNIFNS